MSRARRPIRQRAAMVFAIGALAVLSHESARTRGNEAAEEGGARAWRLFGLRGSRGRIDPLGPSRARHQLADGPVASRPDKSVVPGWIPRGPTNRSGRARALVIHPAQPEVMWAAMGSGGVWKTSDGGAHWRVLTDALGLSSGCLVLDPFDATHLYWGTGERFHAGGPGAGIFESLDGGESWTSLQATRSWRFVHRIAISPADPKILLASVPDFEADQVRGIFRSTDGGATWTQVVAQTGDTYDVKFDPADPTRAVAAVDLRDTAPASPFAALLYSRDAGLTWTRSSGSNLSTQAPVSLAFAPSSPNAVYAFGNPGLFRSADGGVTYTRGGDVGDALAVGWASTLWVSPVDASFVIVGGVYLGRSRDGGTTIEGLRTFDPGGYPNVSLDIGHDDNHAVVEDPGFDGSGNRRVYLVSDGGIYRVDDVFARPFTSAVLHGLDGGMQTTEVYTAAGRGSDDQLLQAVQDSGLLSVRGSSTAAAYVNGGDGACTVFDPKESRYVYGCSQYLGIYRIEPDGTIVLLSSSLPDGPELSSGRRANFVSPVLLDPNSPERMFAAGRSLWRSVDVRTSTYPLHPPVWKEIKTPSFGNFPGDELISAAAIAPSDSNVLMVAYGDGRIHRTSDALSDQPHWTPLDFAASANPLPDGSPLRLVIDHVDPERAWVSFGAFESDNVWGTEDGGATWHSASGTPSARLPDAPVWALAQHPVNRDTLYAGTEVGVYVSGDAGESWRPITRGVFGAAVMDLSFVQGTKTLLAGTYGRGIWTLDTSSIPCECSGPRRRPAAVR